MNSIEAMESEIRLQADALMGILPSKRDGPIIFVGSGDSFAAALAAQSAASADVVCCHPVDLIQKSAIALNRTVCIVSISGRTRANIDAAKIAKRKGLHTIAVTANVASKLAYACDEVVPVNYDGVGVTTAGTLSFSASLLTCFSLVSDGRISKNPGRVLLRAEKQAQGLVNTLDEAGSFLFVANGILYPIALYGSLKMNEVLGVKAFSYPLEEFCHSPVFGAQRSDGIIIFGSGRDGSLNLATRLKQEGFNTAHAMISRPGIDGNLQATFLVQWLALKLAQVRGLKECRFLTDKVALKISSDFIY